MPRLTRYVLWQLLLTFAVTLTGISFIMVFGIMVREGIRNGLGVMAILQLLPFATPLTLRFAVPASILMATCSVFGRMAFDNEVVATKSLGISPRVMLLPAFGFALLASLGMIWLNDIAITWGTNGIKTVIFNSVEEVVFRKLKTDREFHNKHFSINVKQVHGNRLIEPRFESRGEPRVVMDARQAKLHSDLEAGNLMIQLTDCRAEQGGNLVFADSGTYSHVIPLSKATIKDRRDPRVSELGMGKISDETVAQQATLQSKERQMAARAALQMAMGEISLLGAAATHPDGKTWNQLLAEHESARIRLNRLHLEPWRRCAEGFSCLFIVLVGAPLAIHMRTTNFFTTFAMCFFPILCVYYPAVMWAVGQAKEGILPPYVVWVGNAILFVVSIWLTKKVTRY